jgi:hypothetical protein
MIAALGTLPFLATLWLLVVLGARVLEESGAKIAAALKGKLLQRPAAATSRFRARVRLPVAAPSHASVQWRAAA